MVDNPLQPSRLGVTRGFLLLAVPCVLGLAPGLVLRADAQSQIGRDAYVRAEAMLPWNRDRVLFNAEVDAYWIDGSEQLWYRSKSETGWRFIVADPASRTKRPAFDHGRMAEALARVTAATVDSNHLPISELGFPNGAGGAPRIMAQGKGYDCDLANLRCREVPSMLRSPDRAYAPGGRYAVFANGPNLWVEDRSTGQTRALTTDGEPLRAYGAFPGLAGPVLRERTHAVYPPTGAFSPDGSKFLTYRLDETRSPELSLLQYVPEDGTVRPKVWTYRIPLPGDPPETARLIVFDLATGGSMMVDRPPSMIQFRAPLPFTEIEWSPDGRAFYFVDYSEDLREEGLYRTEVETGQTARLIVERSEANLLTYAAPRWAVLSSGDILWRSERSGWRHLYYYDRTGRLDHAITEGDWVVRELLGVDEKTRTLVFSAGGREAGFDPYVRQLYQVGFDGRGLRRLASEPADHQVRVGGRQFVGLFQADVPSAFSTSGRFFLDAFSRVDLPTSTVVRDRTGRLVMTLETARLDTAFARWYRLPEPFKALAADGRSEVFGLVIKPSNFDSTKRYPVLDAVYGGPQTVYVPKRFGGDLNGLYGRSFAELGAIAVVIDGRNTPFRSRAFFDVGYGQLGKAGFQEDHIAAIKALARTRPYVDSSRVGIFGFSAGGYAVIRAMFNHPDFYSVGIETSAYDVMLNEWSWGQKYQGPYDAAEYAKQALPYNVDRFRGKLFLAIGDVDDVVHPSATMRVVDQLIKHDKDFEFLMVPNQDHNLLVLPYLLRRQWDYFVVNLLEAIPPHPYTIHPPGR